MSSFLLLLVAIGAFGPLPPPEEPGPQIVTSGSVLRGRFSLDPTWTWFDHDLGLRDGYGFGGTIFSALDSEVSLQEKWLRAAADKKGWLEWGLQFDLRARWSEDEDTGRHAFVGAVRFGYALDYLLPSGFSIGGSATVGVASLWVSPAGRPREIHQGQDYVVTLPRVAMNFGSGFSGALAADWELLRTGFHSGHYRNTENLSLVLSFAYRF